MIITKEHTQSLIDNYIKQKHSQDECLGFINGIEVMQKLISKSIIRIGRFKISEHEKFAIQILKDYSIETKNLIPSDISPLEEWLILKMFNSSSYNTLIAIGEACMFMQGYKGTCNKDEWSEYDEELLNKLIEILKNGNKQ